MAVIIYALSDETENFEPVAAIKDGECVGESFATETVEELYDLSYDGVEELIVGEHSARYFDARAAADEEVDLDEYRDHDSED